MDTQMAMNDGHLGAELFSYRTPTNSSSWGGPLQLDRLDDAFARLTEHTGIESKRDELLAMLAARSEATAGGAREVARLPYRCPACGVNGWLDEVTVGDAGLESAMFTCSGCGHEEQYGDTRIEPTARNTLGCGCRYCGAKRDAVFEELRSVFKGLTERLVEAVVRVAYEEEPAAPEAHRLDDEDRIGYALLRTAGRSPADAARVLGVGAGQFEGNDTNWAPLWVEVLAKSDLLDLIGDECLEGEPARRMVRASLLEAANSTMDEDEPLADLAEIEAMLTGNSGRMEGSRDAEFIRGRAALFGIIGPPYESPVVLPRRRRYKENAEEIKQLAASGKARGMSAADVERRAKSMGEVEEPLHMPEVQWQ